MNLPEDLPKDGLSSKYIWHNEIMVACLSKT